MTGAATGTRERPVEQAPVRPRAYRHRRVPVSRRELVAVGALAALAAAAAVLWSTAAPTGGDATDAVLRAALAAGTTVAGSRARRALLVWAPWVLAVGASLPWMAALVAAGAAGAVMWRFGHRNRLAGAAIGAVAGLGALHLTRPAVLGATALLAAVALVPLLVSGYRTSRRSAQRRVRIGLAVVGLFILAAAASSVVFGLTEQQRLRTAVAQSVEAARTIGTGPTVDRRPFDRAAAGFDETVRNADSWWMAPARNLPAIGPNVRAVRAAASAAAEVNGTAGELASRIDFERIRRPDGGVDVAAMELLREPVDAAAATLSQAVGAVDASNSPWLVLPLRDRLAEFRELLGDVSDEADTAALAVRTVPGMLGVDGPRRYLLLLGSPAELRDLGGHVGNWAEITAWDGRLEVTRVGEPYELYGPGDRPRPVVADPQAYPDALVGLAPEVFPQNWGGSPDLPTVAQLVSELYPQATGSGPVNGVIYADPWAFSGLLRLTGPVAVPGTDVSLNAVNAVPFLTRDQYLVPDEADVDAALSDVVRDALQRLVTDVLPTPERFTAALGPAVDGGHLLMTSLVPDDQPLLQRLGLDRGVQAVPGEDLLGVVNRNANPSKADAYLRRSVEDRVTWDPATGRVASEVAVGLTNAVPPGAPPLVAAGPPGTPMGTNRTELAVLSPFRLSRVVVDGVPARASTLREAPGLFRHTVVVDLPAGATRTATFSLRGRVAPGDEYRLRWIGQPLVEPERRVVTIRAPEAGVVSPRPVEVPEGRRDADLRYRIDAPA